MGDFILTSTATIMCPHGGILRHIPIIPCEYRIEGVPPMLFNDQYLIAGCPFMAYGYGAGTPSPCYTVQWTNPSIFLLVRGVPALKNTSVGICMSTAMVPQGPAVVASHQISVREPDEFTNVN